MSAGVTSDGLEGPKSLTKKHRGSLCFRGIIHYQILNRKEKFAYGRRNFYAR